MKNRFYLILFAVFASITTALGDSKTFYYSAGAKSTDTAKGKVYVGTSAATGSSTYQNEMTTYTSKTESALGGSAPTKTSGISFYYSAKANDGYVFLGWKTTNSESAAYDDESVNFTWNREVNNTTEINSNPAFDNAKVKYYAFFGSGIINLSHELIAFDKTQTGSFTVNYTANGTINITPTNSDFSVSPTSISATGPGSQTITVSYNGSAVGTANTKINVTCTGLEPKSLDAVAVPGTITSDNASSIVIETGTVSTSTDHPYHPMESIDLTPCFAGTTASFDALYLFGKTLNKTDFTATSLDINTATTPCYVYHKSGNSYVFTKVVEMNSDIKGIGVSVAANNSKLFFSGWCPYASCGYKSDDIGVFHITGGNSARVDVYLNNAWIYARTKFNGHLISDYYAETSSSSYPTGSGGVFVFQTSASTSSASFKAYVHVNGDNLLSSQQGNQIKVSLLGNVRYAAQCSSPIHMYTTNWSSQYEELTIDDVWPSSGGDARTNGALQLMKSTNQAPSIDLGNQRSIVNFNGGRITLQNAIPVSDKYQTAFSISCRSYSQSGVTVYGLGNDQAEGTVNFNDGTIDVLPLSESDYTNYSSYYRDNKSIKCPSNVFINGGSYNCSIWKCDEAADLGASPTDKSGTAVCKLSIAQTGTETNGMAQYAIPSVFKSVLDAYYAEKGWTYGQQSIAADDEGNVNLMLPCDLIDESAIVNTEVIPWVGILPDFSAGAMGHYIDFGGNQTILSDETHSTERFLYGRMDDNVYNELPNYATPTEAASVTLKSNDYNKNALNAEPYTIASNSYILLPIVADHWFFFSAPFDVKKVSLIDAYPDALAAEQTVAQALQKQAESNMDLFYYIGQGLQAGSQLDIEGLISQWVNCEKTIRYPDASSTIKNQFKKREINPYASTSAAIDKNHFWLYENANEWTYDGKNFNGHTLITEKSEDILMQKGKVYSMMFPSEGVATGDWKYWTGKYILIEGGENCEIEGTNSHPSTSESYTSTTKASVKGNHTFADIAAPASLGAFWGYDYTTGTYKHQTSKTNPTQAFIYTAATPNDDTPATLNAIAANGRCYYTISYNSSNITVIAAPEFATYSLENNTGVKYFYTNSAWKQLTYDNEKDLYLGDDTRYYRYNESIQQWELAEFNIIYKDKDDAAFSGSHGSAYPTVHTYGTTTTLINPTKTGYTFDGWFDNSACTGSALTSLAATEYTADITLYAKWTMIPLTLEVTDKYEVGGATLNSTTVKVSGALRVSSGTLTTTDLILESSLDASNEKSGIIDGAEHITVTGNAYFDLTLNTQRRHWRAFTVPFEIDLKQHPIKILPEGVEMPLGVQYDIVYYDGAERAAYGKTPDCWKYVEDDANWILTPGVAYMMVFGRDVNTVRFTKKDEASINYTGDVVLAANSGDGVNGGWNGIGNPATYHALLDAGVTECQVHNGEEIGSDGYTPYDMDGKFIVGKAVFVQVDGSKSEVEVTKAGSTTPYIAAHAPRRVKVNTTGKNRFDVQIAPADGTMADRMFLLADEYKEDKYVILQDLAKAGLSTKRAQMWVERYGTQLCKNTALLVDGTAEYPLGIYAPQAGEYEISIAESPDEESTLYLTLDGTPIWNLSYAPYIAELEKGTTKRYGLQMVRNNAPSVATDINNTQAGTQPAAQKIMLGDHVYILRGGELYSITGAKVK